jgi:hypothetical protein
MRDNKKACIDTTCWGEIKKIYDGDYNSLKLVVYVLSTINPISLDSKSLSDLTFNLSDIARVMNLNGDNRLRIIKNTIVKIKKTIIEMEHNDLWEPVSLFDRVVIDNSKKTATITINKHFLPYLSDLKKYLSIRLQVIGLPHSYFIFYCKLKSINSKCVYHLSLNEILDYCNLSYRNSYDFRRHFLDKCIKKLETIGINIKYVVKKHNAEDAFFFTIKELNQVDSEDTEQSVTECNQLTIDPPAKPAKKEPFEDEIREIFDYYVMVFNRSNSYKLDKQKANAIRARLKEGNNVEMLKMHIDEVRNTPWNMGDNPYNKRYYDLVEHVCNKTKWEARMPKFEALEANKTSSPASNQALKKHNIANNMPEDTPIDHYLTEFTKTHPFLNRGLTEEEYFIVGQKWKNYKLLCGQNLTWWNFYLSTKNDINLSFNIPKDITQNSFYKEYVNKHQEVWQKIEKDFNQNIEAHREAYHKKLYGE